MKLFTRIKYLKNGFIDSMRTSKEILWAEIFNSTIRNSKWFTESVSPGRWAVGYPFLYVLYRVLDELKPDKILELGLGQSSKITCSYVNYSKNSNVLHCIVEHDEEWKNFFLDGNKKTFKEGISKIIVMPLENVDFENTKVTRYERFIETLPKEKWNLILVDAPFGSDKFSRIDVLDLIPQNLSDKFVILIDDCERIGEINTCEKIKEKLSMNNIAWYEGLYSGEKEVRVIVSEDLKFICSL